MTFAEFHHRHQANLALVEPRIVAELAWDAALCAAQQAMFTRGQPLPHHDALAAISSLHTWHPAATAAPQPRIPF
jgi:hypothetical protein